MQVRLAAAIKELGYKLILTDMNPNCSAGAYADAFVERDTFDVSGNLQAAAILRQTYDICACLAIAADCHPTVAYLCQELGLPGISPTIANSCRQKSLTRKILAESGVPQPQSFEVGTLEDARRCLQSLGGRGVIKATDNSASRGFALLEAPDALSPEVFESACASGTTGNVLIEEILIPRKDCVAELSVETIWHEGKMYWLNWVDRLFRSDLKFFPAIDVQDYHNINWAVEIGHINPAVHPVSVKQAIRDMIEHAGRAIGMHEQHGGHVLKADIMLTDAGPVILELTPRLSGGWDSSRTTPSRGADFQVGVLRLALGESLNIDLWHQYFEFTDPSLYAAILTDIVPGAQDCIGRKFAFGSGYDRGEALRNALLNLKESNYVV